MALGGGVVPVGAGLSKGHHLLGTSLRVVVVSALLWGVVAEAASASTLAPPSAPANPPASASAATVPVSPPAGVPVPAADVAAPIRGLSQRFNAVCAGRLVQAVPVMVAQTAVGSLQVRRNRAGFCALVQVDRPGVATVNALQAQAGSAAVAGPAAPVAPAAPAPVHPRLWMYAVLQRCEPPSPATLAPGQENSAASLVCRDELSVHDEGRFFYYAGPVTLAPHGLCVRAEGRIVLAANVEGFAQSASSPALCG